MHDDADDRRAVAARIRHDHVHGRARRRLVTSLVIVAVVAVAVAGVIWFQLQPHDDDSDIAAPSSATDEHGFLLEPAEPDADPVEVVLYEDFLCESCSVFHEQSGEFLAAQLEEGRITLEYRPVAFLLTASTDEYTQRATNAAVCVGDEAGADAYAVMHRLLMENQPEQGGPGLTDEQLIGFAAEAGAADAAECITDRAFGAWVEEALHASLEADVRVTPTVRVNGLNIVRTSDGEESMPGPDELQFAIETAAVREQ